MSDECYARIDGRCVGPVSQEELVEFAQNGTIGPDALVRRGNGGWIRARHVQGLRDALAAAEGDSSGAPSDDDRVSLVGTAASTGVVTCSILTILFVLGPTPSALLIAIAHVIVACFLMWFVHQPKGRNAVRWVMDVIRRIFEAADTRFRHWQRARRARRARAERELERARRARRARQARAQRQVARAMRRVNLPWPSKSGVDASRAVTYGVGREHVYCYTFNSQLELARHRDSPTKNIKVGMASGDPIERISQQISASKTAMSEPAVVLLIFRTNNCRRLERALHQRLDRTAESLGREWFTTHEAELVQLFQAYVREHFRPFDDAVELQEEDYLESDVELEIVS